MTSKDDLTVDRAIEILKSIRDASGYSGKSTLWTPADASENTGWYLATDITTEPGGYVHVRSWWGAHAPEQREPEHYRAP